MTIINPLAANFFVPPAITVPSPEERQTQLRVDQVVHATVAEGGIDRVVLDMEHRKILAQSNVPLATGQKVALQVQEIAPQLVMRLVDMGMDVKLRQALHFLGPVWDWAPALASLAANPKVFREPLSAQSLKTVSELLRLLKSDPESIDGMTLSELSRRLGLSFEAELGKEMPPEPSLKTALFEMLSKLDESRPELRDNARHLLHEIEMFQMCRARMDQEGYCFVPLPLPGLEQAFVTADRRPRPETEEGQGHFALNLFLKLSGLGNMKVDLLYEQGGLWVRFSCEGLEKADFVKSFRDELEQSLTSVQLRETLFTAGAEDPGKVLVRRLVPRQDHVFDERV